ncbi:MAG: succinate dehydrogenase/fumarate reductase iron-sulfur subunit [Oligoflexia bacterium]|nr:succinate dehydrogenase/fumarate reductase iron-sulfur subunit [Oligoflexia bacterium]
MSKDLRNYKLVIWRQASPQEKGGFEQYQVDGISPDTSFLEMLDILNDRLIKQNIRPIEFDSDCREGICGACGCLVNGQAHGPRQKATTCQIYMRSFENGDTITVEPWRAKAFPVIRDLVVDRSSFDRIISAGGYISVKSAKHADANAMLIPKPDADQAFDYATCIGCGACVAACPNASASLFTGAKISQFTLMPQGRVEREKRVERMVDQMDREGFGGCTNIGECEASCPKGISISAIATMKAEYLKAALSGRTESNASDGAM